MEGKKIGTVRAGGARTYSRRDRDRLRRIVCENDDSLLLFFSFLRCER